MARRRWLVGLRFALVVLVAILAAGARSSLAQGAGGTVVNPNEQPASQEDVASAGTEAAAIAGGPYYVVVPAAAFSSDGLDPDGFGYNFAGGYLYGVVDSGACLAAPVTLTPGTTVNAFEVTFYDQNATLAESFELSRVSLLTGTRTVMARVETPSGTTGGVSTWLDTTIVSGEVTNEYAYQITTCVRPSVYVYGMRVGHSARTLLPYVEK